MLTGLVPLIASTLAILTALLSYGMSRKAHALSTRTTEQTSRRGRSEETMRILRWAVELAVDNDERKRRAGVAALQALTESALVVRGDRTFVHAVAAVIAVEATDVTYADDRRSYWHSGPTGGDDG